MFGGLVARRVSYFLTPGEPTGFMPKAARKLFCLFKLLPDFYEMALLLNDVFLPALSSSSGLVLFFENRVGSKVVLDVLARLFTTSCERSKLGLGLSVFYLRPFFVAEAADFGSFLCTKLAEWKLTSFMTSPELPLLLSGTGANLCC